MQREIPESRRRFLTGLLSNHFVPIYLTLTKGNEVVRYGISSFILSVTNCWILMTAGHWFEVEIYEKLRDDFRISQCYLLDNLGDKSEFQNSIPFNLKLENLITVYEDGLDCCFYFLHPYYVQLLLKNNIKPLTEEVWKKQPKEVDSYYLLGMPSELITVGEDFVKTTPKLLSLEKLYTRPKEFHKKEIPMFYGKLGNEADLISLYGMSGGPIFGFFTNEKGETRYWLIALQSSWISTKRYISAVYTEHLGYVLEHFLNRINNINP